MPDNLPTVPTNVEIYKASTDAAAICKEIVLATAVKIQGRRYVRVEGWQAIAVAHGCTASSRDVEELENGVRAIGEVRRMSDGQIIGQAEGFVGKDETTWYGSTPEKKRPDYAIRAMAQTRAISRACRSCFAHVVVMMNAGLSTTPAEEMNHDETEPQTNGEPRGEAKPAAVVQQPAAAKTAPAAVPANGKRTATQFLDELEAACATIAIGDKQGIGKVLADPEIKKLEVWAKDKPAVIDRLNAIRYAAIGRVYEQGASQPAMTPEGQA